ncbi:hypothetical protein ICE_05766 [Bacillus cereus BAG1X1-2]|nr:hypothetical protein ICE_05766 [Bacillus cereus BAG1X1-2]PFV95892.1 hypothetical protein COL22_31440 [Bacillus thuringiensis]PGW73144.1 hypothetical protein COE21_23670 [Bacillus thuringiensis]
MSADSPHYYYNIDHQKMMKRLKLIDLSIFVVLFLWLLSNDFSVKTKLGWAFVVVCIVYAILLIIKLCMRGEDE